MIERVVDDWLTSVNEKNFQVPFAQLLSLEGYTVVHIASPHGPMEQGKDILALNPKGIPCAFQLKAGNLSLRDWRHHEHPLKGQIEDLLDLPIDHPSVDDNKDHQSFLVTTGALDDALRQEISAFNRGRSRKGQQKLEVWVKDHLKRKVENSLGHFLPQNLTSFRDFLRLYLAEGKGFPDRVRVASFLEQLATAGKVANLVHLRQRAAELIIVGSYLADSYQKSGNHASEIEVWTLVAAQLLHLAATVRYGPQHVRVSLGFVEVAIWKAMTRLVDEIKEKRDYVEGSPFSDAFVYRARITYLMGVLSTVLFWDKWLHGKSSCDEVVRVFMTKNHSHMWLWGESAVPSFLAAGWAADLVGLKQGAEITAAQIARHVILLNSDVRRREITHAQPVEPILSAHSRGLPNPYVSVADVLKSQMEPFQGPMQQSYIGQSYSLEALIHLLARGLNRQLLKTLWYDISHVAFATFRPERQEDLWRWHNAAGMIEHRYTEQPTSWACLNAAANKADASLLPPTANDYPHFLALFTLVAPHRMNSAIVTLLDEIEWEKGASILGKT